MPAVVVRGQEDRAALGDLHTHVGGRAAAAQRHHARAEVQQDGAGGRGDEVQGSAVTAVSVSAAVYVVDVV
ncbi:hypothetical protein ACFZDK_01410 [Streptomyces sp. NPDC007901]|uniref:hypothetical protein n=1 Tax=Streptomyces sp. NPDC007901 TaxID=3364785 RepID=UPI0036E1CA25